LPTVLDPEFLAGTSPEYEYFLMKPLLHQSIEVVAGSRMNIVSAGYF
jgi:hypothetical protein